MNSKEFYLQLQLSRSNFKSELFEINEEFQDLKFHQILKLNLPKMKSS